MAAYIKETNVLAVTKHDGLSDLAVKDENEHHNNNTLEHKIEAIPDIDMATTDASSTTDYGLDTKMDTGTATPFTNLDMTRDNAAKEEVDLEMTGDNATKEEDADDKVAVNDFASENASDEEEELVADSRCKAQTKCVAQSGDYRKVVSHIFGRNKKCTRDLPENAWILWCRKHYQRYRYRAEDDGNWHIRQLELVRKQLDEFETLSNVSSWDITLRKTEQSALDAENASMAAGIIAGASTISNANVPSGATSATNVETSNTAEDIKPDAPAITKKDDSDERASLAPSTTRNVMPSANTNALGQVSSRSDAASDGNKKTPEVAPDDPIRAYGFAFAKSDTKASKAIRATSALLPNTTASKASEAIISQAMSPLNNDIPDTAVIAGPSTTIKAEPKKESKKITKTPSPITTSFTPVNPTFKPESKSDSDDLSSVASSTPSEPNLAINNDSKDATNKDANNELNNTSSPSPSPTTPPPVWERFLTPHLGTPKTYTEVRAVLALIEAEFHTPTFQAREPAEKQFPGVEFLPNFPDTVYRKRHYNAKNRSRKAKGSGEGGRKRKAGGDGGGEGGEGEGGNKRRRTLRSSGSA